MAICIRIESSHRSGRAWKPSPAIDPQGLAQGFTLSLEPCVGRQPQRQRKAPDQHEPTDQPRHDDLLALDRDPRARCPPPDAGRSEERGVADGGVARYVVEIGAEAVPGLPTEVSQSKLWSFVMAMAATVAEIAFDTEETWKMVVLLTLEGVIPVAAKAIALVKDHLPPCTTATAKPGTSHAP